MQTQASPAVLQGGPSNHRRCHYGHNFLRWGITQGNIVNKAKFMPCPVVISWQSPRLLKAGETVLCLHVKCSSLLSANKHFTKWMSSRTGEPTQEHALWGPVPRAAVGPQPRNLQWHPLLGCGKQNCLTNVPNVSNWYHPAEGEEEDFLGKILFIHLR